MNNIWWDGYDSRTRAYFFWKWEYDRRNQNYCCDYFRAISTGKPSPEYFHKTYKHEHLNPAEGPDISDILESTLKSSKHFPFKPYPPDNLYLDETGGDGHHDEQECIHFIISSDTILFNINPNIDLATHINILKNNFDEVTKGWKERPPTTTQRIFPFAGLRGLYIPKGYRQRDNHTGRAIGLALYDLEVKGISWQQSIKHLTTRYASFAITDRDENTLRRYLRATRDCVNRHEVLPLT